jgi:hypothetical protein
MAVWNKRIYRNVSMSAALADLVATYVESVR